MKFKKIFALFFSVFLIALVLPVTALPVRAAEQNMTGEQATQSGYTFEDESIYGGVRITAIDSSKFSSALTFPAYIDNKPVTIIGKANRSNNWDCISTVSGHITSISLPSTVKLVDTMAFADFTNVTSISLNEGLEGINFRAFDNVYMLPAITIPNSVKEIANNAFHRCYYLRSVTFLTSGRVSLGWRAFMLEGKNAVKVENVYVIKGATISGSIDGERTEIGAVITYNNVEGASNPNPTYYLYNTGINSFSQLSGRAGYTFAGWSPSSISNTDTGEKTISAQWTPNQITVSLDEQNGNAVNDVVYTYATTDNESILLPTPTRTGFVFTGWYTSSSGGTEVTTITNTTYSANTTLYAQWLRILDTPAVDIDFDEEKLVGLSETTYTIDGTQITLDVDGSLDIDENWLGKDIQIIAKGDNVLTTDSAVQTLSIPARLPAPTDLTAVDERTYQGENGEIQGLDDTKIYEYRKISDAHYTQVTASSAEIAPLAPGMYYVRLAATSNDFVSPDSAALTINAYIRNTDATLSDLTFNGKTIAGFSPSRTAYAMTVAYKTSTATLAGIPADNKNAEVSGDLDKKMLGVGANTFTVTVTAEDGSTTDYVITITRQEAPKIEIPPYTPYHAPAPSYNPGGTNKYTSKTGITSTVTVTDSGVTVDAGLNKSGSVNSEATAAAVKKAAEIAKKNGEPSVTIIIPEGATGLSASTVQKLVKAANGTEIVLALTSMTDGEEVGSISLPINNKTEQILTGLYFETTRIYTVQNYIKKHWNPGILSGFETAQKGGWGTVATLKINLEKLGFEAKEGEELYALIYDTKAKKWYQSAAEVIDGEVVIKTKRTGIVTIVTDSVK
ncbi:MAG: InlB B-repeat-containing protein [Ruminococcus sp.]|jgi:uncharacterized repeat protein (TIGR02543 family)|nr:InlB B-repeat-containing protein [Ruminococcus sp.]